jgi:multidrug resistance efflux pump
MTPRIPIPWPRRLEDFRLRWVPLLVWLLAISAVVSLYELRNVGQSWVGMAQSQEWSLTVPSSGRIDSIEVKLFSTLRAGDVVARLDPSFVEAALKTARAESERLVLQGLALEEEFQIAATDDIRDHQTDLRRAYRDRMNLQMDISKIQLEMLRRRIELEADRLEIVRLDAKLARASALVAAEVLSQEQAEDFQLRRDVLVAQVAAREDFLTGLSFEQLSAQQRVDALSEPDSFVADPFAQRLQAQAAALNVQEYRLAELALQRDALVVMATQAGQVIRLSATPGQTLSAGDSLCEYTTSAGNTVVAYLRAPSTQALRLGDSVLIRRLLDASAEEEPVRETLVAKLAPHIAAIPNHLWRDPSIPEYGREVVLAPIPGLGLVLVEQVQVSRLP